MRFLFDKQLQEADLVVLYQVRHLPRIPGGIRYSCSPAKREDGAGCSRVVE